MTSAASLLESVSCSWASAAFLLRAAICAAQGALPLTAPCKYHAGTSVKSIISMLQHPDGTVIWRLAVHPAKTGMCSRTKGAEMLVTAQ